MYSIDYFKTETTQMEIGQVICIHGQYPCSLWYVKNIEDDYNQLDGCESVDEDLDHGLSTLYEIEYDGISYYPKMNPPKILQVYNSNIKYNIIYNKSVLCQFPSNYIQLYHLQRVHQRAPSFGDMIQLKYYDAFMPFMVINYSPADKAHFVMSLHTSRIFKTYHLILELSEFSTLSTKELRYSIITSSINKGYSLELQKIDYAIESKTRSNYLYNIVNNTYDLEDVITQMVILDEPINNIPTQSMEWYCHSDSGYDSTSDDEYSDASMSPRLPIYIPMKIVGPVETYNNSTEHYEQETINQIEQSYQYSQKYYEDYEDDHCNHEHYEDYEDDQYNHEHYEDYEDDHCNHEHCEDYEDDQYTQEEYEEYEDYDKQYKQEDYVDYENQYNQEDYEDYEKDDNQSNIEQVIHQFSIENHEIDKEKDNIIHNSHDAPDKTLLPKYEKNTTIENDNQKTYETYSFFTDDIINELKSFFNEDAQKEIDMLLNDTDVIEVGNVIKNAVSEVISYLHMSYEPTEDLATPTNQEEVSAPLITEEEVSAPTNQEEVSAPLITEEEIPTPTNQEEVSAPLIIEDGLNNEISYGDVIVINNEDIHDVSIDDAPTPCSIM